MVCCFFIDYMCLIPGVMRVIKTKMNDEISLEFFRIPTDVFTYTMHSTPLYALHF